MPNVRLRDNEEIDSGVRRFRRACEREGILSEYKRRRFHEKASEIRRKQKIQSRRRKPRHDKYDFNPTF